MIATMGEYWSEPVGPSLSSQLSKYLIYSVDSSELPVKIKGANVRAPGRNETSICA